MKIRVATASFLLAAALRGEVATPVWIYDHTYSSAEPPLLVRFERVVDPSGPGWGIAQVSYGDGQWGVFGGREARGGLRIWYLDMSPALNDFEVLQAPERLLEPGYWLENSDGSTHCTVELFELVEGHLAVVCRDRFGGDRAYDLTRIR